MNNQLSIGVPFKTLTKVTGELIFRKYESMQSLGRIGNAKKQTSKTFTKFFQKFLSQVPTVQSLIETHSLKHLHCPFTIKELFVLYVEERILLLKKNNPDDTEIDQLFTELKITLAEASWMQETIELEPIIRNFLVALSKKLKAVGIDNSEFISTLDQFVAIFKIPFLQDTPLMCFLTKELQTKDLFHSPEAMNIDMPVSAFIQSLEIMMRTFRKELLWINQVYLKYKEQSDSIVAKLTEDGQVIRIDELALFQRLEENLNNMSASYEEISDITKLFDNFAGYISDFRLRKEAMSRLSSFFLKAEKTFEVISTSAPCNEPLETFVLSTKRITKTANVFLTEPARNIMLYSNLLLKAWVQLNKELQDPRMRLDYLQTQIPLDSQKFKEEKVATLPDFDQLPTRKKRVRKKKAPQFTPKAPSKADNKENRALVLHCEKEFHQTEPTSIQFSPLQKLSRALVQFTKSASCNNSRSREALIHASWHLGKCELLYKTIMEQKIQPASYLNLLSTFCFSAALSLEQIYRYQLLNKESEDQEYTTSHNLLKLHLATFPSTPVPEAVNTLKLAIIWTRYFHTEQYEILNYFTFHQQQLSPLLLKMIQLSSNHQSVLPESFRKDVDRIYNELTSAIPEIATFISDSTYMPLSTPQSLMTPIQETKLETVTSISQVSTIIQKDKFMDVRPRLTLIQLRDSLAMLENSLGFLNASSTYEELNLWVTRCLFLIEESADLSLRTLDLLKNGATIRNHNIAALAESTEIEIDALSSSLQGMALKLKYPVSTEAQSLGAKMIDELEALCHYPELDEGAEVAKSALIPEWRLPLKNVKSNEILNNLNFLIQELNSMLEQKVFPEIDRLIT